MTDQERREAARQFCQKWINKGREDENARSYWIDFLQDIMGMDHVTDRVDIEKKVIGEDGNTKRIDVYIPETKVLIEQKAYGFKYLGTVTVYSHLQACGIINDHGKDCPCYQHIIDNYPTVVLIDVTAQPSADLSDYDRIGLASGIYYSSFAKQIVTFASEHMPEGKDVFYIYTHGAPKGGFLKAMREIADKKRCREIGAYHCQGYDTFGPFKLVGGLAKGRCVPVARV